MKNFSPILLLLATPASVMAQSSLPPYAAAAISEFQEKTFIFIGCSLAGALLGALLARRIDKKRRATRELTFSLSTLAGAVVGLFVFLGKI